MTSEIILQIVFFALSILTSASFVFLLITSSDYDEYLERLHDFIETLDNVEKVEVLPYHTLGEYKWKELGYDYPLAGIDPPTKERVENAKKILHCS